MDNTVSGSRQVSFESPPESAPAQERHDRQLAQPSSPAGGAAIAGLRTIGARADTPARAFSPRPVSPLTKDEMMSVGTARPVSPEAGPPIPRPAAWRIGNVPASAGNASPPGSLPEPGRPASAVSNGRSPSHADTPAGTPKQPDEDWRTFLTRTGHSPGPEAPPTPSGSHAQTAGHEDWRTFLTRTGHSPGPEAPPSPSGSHAQTGGHEDWHAFLTRTGHVTEPDAATVPSGSHTAAREDAQDSLPSNLAGHERMAFADVPLQAPKPVRPHATAHVLRDVPDRSPAVPAPLNPAPARADARRNPLRALRDGIRRILQ